jgi:3-oxoacyl-[acyl-carrier protein] reductase
LPQVDVAESAQADELIKAVVGELGSLYALVNNAGITRDNLLMRMKDEDWDAVLQVNLKGAFNCARAAVRPMLKARGGRIINITSVVGIQGNAGQTNYAASKAGLIGFTKSLARELASRAITVNAVAPGLVPDTGMTDELSQEVVEGMLAQVPLGRPGTPEDVAHAVGFLAGDEAAYITGQVISVDGGMAM